MSTKKERAREERRLQRQGGAKNASPQTRVVVHEVHTVVEADSDDEAREKATEKMKEAFEGKSGVTYVLKDDHGHVRFAGSYHERLMAKFNHGKHEINLDPPSPE